MAELSLQRNVSADTPPPFDPSKPYEEVSSGTSTSKDTPPPFDPSQPYDEVDSGSDTTTTQETLVEEVPQPSEEAPTEVYTNTKKLEIDKLHDNYIEAKVARDMQVEKQKSMMLSTRKERARQETGELEEHNVVTSALTGDKFTNDSVLKKWNSLQQTGLTNNQVMQELGKLGVPDTEISKARSKLVGNLAGDTTLMEDISTGIDMAKSVGAQVGMWGGEYLNALSASKDSYADVLSRYSPMTVANNLANGRDAFDRGKLTQDFYDAQRAKHDAISEQIKKDIYHGGGSFSEFTGSHTLDAASFAYNPTSIAKQAFVGGLFSGAMATKEGANTGGINSAIMLGTIGAGVLTGAFKYGPSIYAHIKAGKSPKELPTKMQAIWQAMRHRTGLSDEELMQGFRAYGKEFSGKDPEELMSSYIAHTIANKPSNARGGTLEDLYHNTIVGDKKAATEVRKAMTSRARELDKIHSESALGKLRKKRTVANSDGIAVDWEGLLGDINNYARTSEGAFDNKSPVIKLIARNAKLYGSNDIAIKKVLDGLKFNDKTVGEEVVDAFGNIVKARITTELASGTGVKTIASNSGFSKLASLAVNYSPSGILARKIFKKIPVVRDSLVLKEFILEELGKGPILNPRALEAEVRRFQATSTLSDKEVDSLVDEIVEASQMTEISAHNKKVTDRLKELNTRIKELQIEKSEAQNKVEFARVARDEAGSREERLQAMEALQEAEMNNRRVIAENNEAIIDNKKLQMTLSSLTPARPHGRVMKPILKRFVDKGRVLNPKPSDFLKTEEVVSPKPPVKTLETIKEATKPIKESSPEVRKLDDQDTQALRDVQRELRAKHGTTAFGKDVMEEFQARIDNYTGKRPNGPEFGAFLREKLKDGSLSDEQVVDYYRLNPSLGTKTKLEKSGQEGVSGISKRTHGTIKDNDKIINQMVRDGFSRGEAIRIIGGAGLGVLDTGVNKRDFNSDGKIDYKDAIVGGTIGGLLGASLNTTIKVAKGTPKPTVVRKLVDTAESKIAEHLSKYNTMVVNQGGKQIPITIKNKVMSVDSTKLIKGSGEGTKLYRKLLRVADKNGLKYDTAGVSKEVGNSIARHIRAHYETTGNLPLVGGMKRLKQLEEK